MSWSFTWLVGGRAGRSFRTYFAFRWLATVQGADLVRFFLARCDVAVISSRRGFLPCQAEGWGARYAVSPCASPLGLAAVSACREEITTGADQDHQRCWVYGMPQDGTDWERVSRHVGELASERTGGTGVKMERPAAERS
jgi:hypothetical protein